MNPRLVPLLQRLTLIVPLAVGLGACRTRPPSAPPPLVASFSARTPSVSFANGTFEGSVVVSDHAIEVLVPEPRISVPQPGAARVESMSLRVLWAAPSGAGGWRRVDSTAALPLGPIAGEQLGDTVQRPVRPLRFEIPRSARTEAAGPRMIVFQFIEMTATGTLAWWYARSDTLRFAPAPESAIRPR